MQHQRQILRQRNRRGVRVRNRVKRDAMRPRLAIFRSHQNIYAQIIDDAAGKTLAAASSRDQALRQEVRYGGNKTAAAAVGKAIAQRALGGGRAGGRLRPPRLQVPWPRRRAGRSGPRSRIEVLGEPRKNTKKNEIETNRNDWIC